MTQDLQEPSRSKKPFPWIRVALMLTYIGLGVALIIYETNAHKILFRGQRAAHSQHYQTAGLAYRIVIEKFPLSFAVIEAKKGLDGIKVAIQGSSLPNRLNTSWMARTLDPYSLDWLPFLAGIACSAVLFLVFLTRIRRKFVASFALAMFCISAFWAVGQLSLYGWRLMAHLFVERQAVYIGTYVLIGATVLLTLSRTAAAVDLPASSTAKDRETDHQRSSEPIQPLPRPTTAGSWFDGMG